MPYANPTAAAVSNRERQRRFRARKREAAHLAAQLPPETLPDVLPTDAAGLLSAWCSERLIVPPGHPLAGQPMHLPEYVRGFLGGCTSNPRSRKGCYARQGRTARRAESPCSYSDCWWGRCVDLGSEWEP